MTVAAARRSPWVRFTADERRTDVAVAAITVAVAVLLATNSSERFDTGWPEVAAGVGAFVIVLLRRRWPLPLLLVSLVWSAAHVVIWDRASIMVFAVFVLLFTTCVGIDRVPAIALGAGVGLVLYVLAVVVNDDLQPGDPRVLISAVWAGAAVGTADAVRSWRRYRESAEAQIRSTLLASEARARQQVTEERLTIARELHDLLAHNLSVMNVQTGAALHLLRSDPDRAEESLTAARDAGRSVLDELRELLDVLRHDTDDDDDQVPRTSLPAVDDLPLLVDTMRSAGLSITWTDDGPPRTLAPAVSLAAYRIVQEALTNAAKHGDGTADLHTRWGADRFTIIVANPLRVSATSRDHSGIGGHGLIGMRERAVLNGGSLVAGPTPTSFEVRAWLPIAPDTTEAGP